MRIGRPLLKLPVRFCGETLAREVAALPASAWMPHPQRFDGNISVPLVTPEGALTHGWFGPMGATAWLRRCPYILGIMQELDATWGRSRLMGLEPGADVPEHVDIHYYWRTHLRIHIPIMTNPNVGFSCNGETIHMAAGECWILDSFYRHSVVNHGNETRVHLVLDTVGSGPLWDRINAALGGAAEEEFLRPTDEPVRSLDFEQVNAPAIMSPWEMKTHVAYMADWTDSGPDLQRVLEILDRFIMAWSGTWARYEISEAGLPYYAKHLDDVRAALAKDGSAIVMRNGRMLVDSIERFVLTNAIAAPIVQKMQGTASGVSSSRMMGQA